MSDLTPWHKLLSDIKSLYDVKNTPQKKVFISYAWDDPNTPEGLQNLNKLQTYLKALRDDFTMAGINVFLDLSDMKGDIKFCMDTELRSADFVIPIFTQRFNERMQESDSNLVFEYNLMMEKHKQNPNCVIPILYSGQSSIVPKPCKDVMFFKKSNTSYQAMMVGLQAPLGILPIILGFHLGDINYTIKLQDWARKKVTNFGALEPSFIRRTTYMAQIQSQLEKTNQAALSGMNGIGKSEIALQFCHENKKKYDVIRWMRAGGNSLKEEFEQLAADLDIKSASLSLPDLMLEISVKLGKGASCLVVMDNVGNPQSVKAYLDELLSRDYHVLVTTINDLWDNSIPVVGFSEAETVEMVNGVYAKTPLQEIKKFLDRLGGVPIEMKQALAQMKRSTMSLSTWNKTPLTPGSNSSISLEVLNNIKPDTARFMLEYCAFLAGEMIPLALFRLESSLGSSLAVNDAIPILREYSFITSTVPDYVQINSLTQKCIQNVISAAVVKGQRPPNYTADLIVCMSKSLNEIFPWKMDEEDSYELLRILKPHVDQLISHATAGLNVADLSRCLGLLEGMKRVATQNLEHFTEIAASFEKLLYTYQNGEEVPAAELEVILGKIAHVFHCIDDQRTVKLLVEKALKQIETPEKPFEKYVDEIMLKLARIIGNIGDVGVQQMISQKTLEIRESRDGPSSLLVAALAPLAKSTLDLGDRQGAELHVTRAAQLLQKFGTLNEIEGAMVISKTAGQIENVAAQTQIIRSFLDLMEKSPSCSLPDLKLLSGAANHVADVNGRQEFLRRVLALQIKHSSAQHPDAATTLFRLAVTMSDPSSAATRTKMLWDVLAVQRQHCRDSYQVANTLMELACTPGQDPHTHLMEAQEILKRLSSSSDLHVAKALCRLSAALHYMPSTMKYLQRAFEIQSEHYSSTSPVLGKVHLYMSFVEEQSSRHVQAIEMVDLALKYFGNHVKYVKDIDFCKQRLDTLRNNYGCSHEEFADVSLSSAPEDAYLKRVVKFLRLCYAKNFVAAAKLIWLTNPKDIQTFFSESDCKGNFKEFQEAVLVKGGRDIYLTSIHEKGPVQWLFSSGSEKIIGWDICLDNKVRNPLAEGHTNVKVVRSDTVGSPLQSRQGPPSPIIHSENITTNITTSLPAQAPNSAVNALLTKSAPSSPAAPPRSVTNAAQTASVGVVNLTSHLIPQKIQTAPARVVRLTWNFDLSPEDLKSGGPLEVLLLPNRSYQRNFAVFVTPEPASKSVKQLAGNNYLLLNYPAWLMPASISITLDVGLNSHPVTQFDHMSNHDNDEPRLYLGATEHCSPKIDPKNTTLCEKLPAIIAGATQNRDKAVKIMEWISEAPYEHLPYGVPQPSLSEYITNLRYLESGARSLLFVAFARAANIPARRLFSPHVQDHGPGKMIFVPYMMAEYFDEIHNGWIPVDFVSETGINGTYKGQWAKLPLQDGFHVSSLVLNTESMDASERQTVNFSKTNSLSSASMIILQ